MFYEVKCSYDRFVKASASAAVDLGLIPSQIKSISNLFTTSLLDAQHERDSVGNKPASLLVASLVKALNGISPS